MYNEIPVTEPIEKIFDSFWNLHRTEGREIRDVKAEREQNRSERQSVSCLASSAPALPCCC
ncbi:unnamed protein product [Prunus brigantina]